MSIDPGSSQEMGYLKKLNYGFCTPMVFGPTGILCREAEFGRPSGRGSGGAGDDALGNI